MDDIFDRLNCRLRVSGLVADSIMMGIVNSAMEEAYWKVCSKEGDLERLNEKSRFCELAIMQLEWCLKFMQEEVTNYIVESSREREKLVSELIDTRDRIQKRLEETELAIAKKDKELTERMETELRLRQALKSKDEELSSLRVILELERTKRDRVWEFVLSNQFTGDEDRDNEFCELKNSLDQQFWNIKRKLEDGQVHSTDEMKKLNESCSNTLKLEGGVLEPKFELVEEGNYNMDDINFSVELEEVQNNGCKGSRMYESGKGSQVELLNCCVQTEVTERKLKFEQMGTDIDILKEMLDVGFETVRNTFSLSKVGLTEQQWGCSVEKEIVALVLRGFLRDAEENFKAKFLDEQKKVIPSLTSEKRSSLIDDIKILRHELEQFFLIQTEVLSMSSISCELGISSSTSYKGDSGGKSISQNRTLSKGNSVDTNYSGDPQKKYRANALQRCGKSDIFLKFEEFSRLEDLPKEDAVGHSHHYVAEMIRSHESIITKKTKEINWLKGEILREKGRYIFRKDKNFDCVKKLIPKIISRLDCIVEEYTNSCVNLDDLEKGKPFLQNILSQSILANDEKVIVHTLAEAPQRLGDEIVSRSVDMDSREVIKHLKEEREDFNIQTVIMEETHTIVFKGVVKQMCVEINDNEMESLIKEDIYNVSFKEMVREWNSDKESYNIEGLMREEIYRIVFSEIIKDINCSVNLTLANCQEAWNQDTSLEDIVLANNFIQSLQVSKGNNLMQEMDSLKNTFEVVEDFMSSSTELMEMDKHFDLSDRKLDELDKESIQKDDTFGSVKSKLEKALQQIIISKAQLKELGCSLGIVVGGWEEANHLTVLFEGIADNIPNGEKQWNALDSIVVSLKDFSRGINDFELIIHEKLRVNIMRLEEARHQMDQLIQHVPSIKDKKLLYRKAFMRRCFDLQTAEVEVDLLGDKVDALLCLLEQIYISLYHYSPVLKPYFGIMDILKQIRNELNREAALTHLQ